MLFALLCRDKPGASDLRLSLRAQHLAYIEAHRGQVKLAGPFLSEDGQMMVGSLLIIEAADRRAAEIFAAADPYRTGGLFASVEIIPWRWTIGAPA